MVITIAESTNIPKGRNFGLKENEFTFSTGQYPNNVYEKITLPQDTYFMDFKDFVEKLNHYCNHKLPKDLDNYMVVDFDNLTSKLTLGWQDDNREWHNLWAELYNAPYALSKNDLSMYGIKTLKY